MMKIDVKAILVERLSPLFEGLGFIYHDELPGKFINEQSEYSFVEMFLGTSQKSPRQSVSSFQLCFYEVENKLMELESVPGLNFRELKGKGIYHSTIMHQFPEELTLLKYKVNTEDDLEVFLSNIELYVHDYGLPFVQKHLTLEDLLRSMDELTSIGKHWNVLLNGGPEFLFRGLIISKLCQDKNFVSKLNMVEKLVVDELIDQAWIDAFERMKVILSNT